MVHPRAAADHNPGECITRGVEHLAPRRPAWWAAGPGEIDLETLDLLDLEYGILAQIFGGHEKGLRALHIPPELAPEFGFAAIDADNNMQLRRIWKVIIISLRAEYAASSPPRRPSLRKDPPQ